MRVDKQAVVEIAAAVAFILSAVVATSPHVCAEVASGAPRAELASAPDGQPLSAIQLTPEGRTTING